MIRQKAASSLPPVELNMRVIGMGVVAALAMAWVHAGWAVEKSPTAEAVLAAAKRASGGNAWDKLPGLQLKGEGGGARFTMWFDLHDYGQRMELEKDGKPMEQGYNGQSSWTTVAGKTTLEKDPRNLALARNGAYFGSTGYFFPTRFKAAFKYLRLEHEGAASFDVIEVTPEGGIPVELWFDRKTRLLDRYMDRAGPQVIKIAQLDYRWAAGVRIPFRARITDPSGKVLEEGRSDHAASAAIDRKQFDPPAP